MAFYAQLKKYNTAFTVTATENAALKKENTFLEAELESKSQESIEKRLREAQIHQEYQKAKALLNRIPKEILDQARREVCQSGKQLESR